MGRHRVRAPVGRLPSLTVCRGFAAFAVFWRHSAGGLAIAGAGATAVSFFFILSGFVLEWSATRAPDDRPAAFYWRRFARIYPAYALSIIVGFAYYWYITGVHPGLKIAATNLFLIQSWIPSGNYYYALNGVAWSLSCEAFFYLLFPFIRRWFQSLTARGAGALAVICIAINFAVVYTVHDSTQPFHFWLIYIFPAFRILEFIAGMLLARVLLLRPSLRVPWKPALALAATAFVLCSKAPEWAQWSTVTFVPYALLIVALARLDAAAREPSRPWLLVKLGEWSYAFYLFHQLILKISASVVGRTSSSLGLKVVLIDLAIAIASTAIIYEVFERPAETKLRAMWRTGVDGRTHDRNTPRTRPVVRAEAVISPCTTLSSVGAQLSTAAVPRRTPRTSQSRTAASSRSARSTARHASGSMPTARW